MDSLSSSPAVKDIFLLKARKHIIFLCSVSIREAFAVHLYNSELAEMEAQKDPNNKNHIVSELTFGFWAYLFIFR